MCTVRAVQLLTLGDVGVGVGGCHNDGSKHNASCHGQSMLQAHDCSQQNWQRLIDSKKWWQPVCGILSAVRPLGLQAKHGKLRKCATG